MDCKQLERILNLRLTLKFGHNSGRVGFQLIFRSIQLNESRSLPCLSFVLILFLICFLSTFYKICSCRVSTLTRVIPSLIFFYTYRSRTFCPLIFLTLYSPSLLLYGPVFPEMFDVPLDPKYTDCCVFTPCPRLYYSSQNRPRLPSVSLIGFCYSSLGSYFSILPNMLQLPAPSYLLFLRLYGLPFFVSLKNLM